MQRSNSSPQGKPFINRVKELLRVGKPTVGAIMHLPSAQAAIALAHVGFDWLWIDMEHGGLNIETVHMMIQATTGTNTVPIVRVPVNHEWLAKPLLDVGAMGIAIPMVNTKEEALAAVRGVRFPPEGVRGFGGATFAASRWGLSVPEYIQVANQEILTVVQIEHIDAVKRIEEIVTVPGIDVLFVGAFDLSGSMGLLGKVNHPKVEKATQTVLAAAQKAGIPAGTIVLTPQGINKRIAQGFTFLVVGTDIQFLTSAAHNLLAQIER